MKDEDYRKATECCKILDCENCPIKEEDYCQEWLNFEKYKREHKHEIGEQGLNMHTYEAWSKEEIADFFEATQPSIWQTDTRIDPESMRVIYILRWIK